METGIVVVCLGASCWFLIRYLQDGLSPWKVGLALALLTAARIDTLPFSVATTVAIFLLKDRRMAFRVALPCVIYCLLYCIINASLFGRPIPVSGYLRASLGRTMLNELLTSGDPEFLFHGCRNMTEFGTLGGRIPLAVPLLALVAVLGCIWILKGTRRAFYMICLLNGIGLFGYYAFMYRSLLSMYTYYYFPLIYTGVMCVFILIATVPWHWLRMVSVSTAVLASLLFGAIYITNRFSLADFTSSREKHPRYLIIEEINRNLPGEAIIACWDAGEIGFRTRKPVINLDGLVNNYQYQRVLKEQGLAAYLDMKNVSHVTNFGSSRRKLIEDQLQWDLLWETSQKVRPLASIFSLAPHTQSIKRVSIMPSYIYQRPSTRNSM